MLALQHGFSSLVISSEFKKVINIESLKIALSHKVQETIKDTFSYITLYNSLNIALDGSLNHALFNSLNIALDGSPNYISFNSLETNVLLMYKINNCNNLTILINKKNTNYYYFIKAIINKSKFNTENPQVEKISNQDPSEKNMLKSVDSIPPSISKSSYKFKISERLISIISTGLAENTVKYFYFKIDL